jgi:hypothetical protein
LDADEIVAQGTNEIQEDNIDPGTYYVNVSAPGVPTPYKISAISEPGSRVDIENYDPLFPGIPTTGTLTQNDNFDPNDEENYADPYLLAELGAGLTVTVTQESEDFDAYLRVVDLLTGKEVAKNDDISTSDGDFNARVSFTTEPGVQYVVFASSVDAPGLGDYTLNTTVTGTPIANAVRSASAETLLPPPVYTSKGQATKNFIYAPLTGGLGQPIQISGLNQQSFGNCAFLAALGATFGKITDPDQADSKESAILNNAIKPDGDNYTLQFYSYEAGKPKTVTVDNQVVTTEEQQTVNIMENNVLVETKKIPVNLVFGAKWRSEFSVKPSDATGQSIWGPIFERAYAKFRGEETGRNGYDVTGNGDQGGIALKRVTGKEVENIFWDDGKKFNLAGPLTQNPGGGISYEPMKLTDESDPKKVSDEVFKRIQTTLDSKGYVVAGTRPDAEQGSLDVLIKGHAYSVHNAYVNANNQQMILLRNPWGKDNTLNKKAPDDPSKNTQDGFVAIKFEEFVKHFKSLALSKA